MGYTPAPRDYSFTYPALQKVAAKVESDLRTGKFTAAQLCSKYRLAPATLRKWCRLLNLFPEPVRRKSKLTKKQLSEVRDLYENHHEIKIAEIANQYGLCRSAIHKLGKKHNWGKRVIITPLPIPVLMEIRDLYENHRHIKIKEIEKQFGVTHEAIKYLVKKYNWNRRMR